MSRGKSQELQQRVFDLEGAMQGIGRIVVDESLTPRQRIARAAGILQMYECLPVAAPSKES